MLGANHDVYSDRQDRKQAGGHRVGNMYSICYVQALSTIGTGSNIQHVMMLSCIVIWRLWKFTTTNLYDMVPFHDSE